MKAIDNELTGFLQEFEAKAETTVKEVSKAPEAYTAPDSPAKSVADKGGKPAMKWGVGAAVAAVVAVGAVLFGLKRK